MDAYDFPDSGILRIIMILRIGMFILIGRITDCFWYWCKTSGHDRKTFNKGAIIKYDREGGGRDLF